MWWSIRKRVRRKRIRMRCEDIEQYAQYKEKARTLVHTRLTYWNEYYQLDYRGVAIRNQSSRWGSCSSQRNLNFNYKIIFLPPELVDYIIVHELCHLAEMNHSIAFWNRVAETIPQYTLHRNALRKIPLHSLTAETFSER